MFLFLCEFFIFCISTLDWCIYVFFRILHWVVIWFCIFKLLSFFFSMIVKCYFIAYKYSLQEYNVILLYIMAWIIWCLAYNYIFLFWCFFFSFYFLFLSRKRWLLSLSLFIHTHTHTHIIYSFLQHYFRLMNHCIFLYNIIG